VLPEVRALKRKLAARLALVPPEVRALKRVLVGAAAIH